jgi:hypothetical protein
LHLLTDVEHLNTSKNPAMVCACLEIRSHSRWTYFSWRFILRRQDSVGELLASPRAKKGWASLGHAYLLGITSRVPVSLTTLTSTTYRRNHVDSWIVVRSQRARVRRPGLGGLTEVSMWGHGRKGDQIWTPVRLDS